MLERESLMSLVKLGKRRLVVIPQEYCDQLGIEIGDFFEILIEGEKLVMVPKKVVDATIMRPSNDNIHLPSTSQDS
jgi:bifunctional DNA-binding transcriptional regulator/antitoxin component of YhaV-PrlF toxin-antitoxin module